MALFRYSLIREAADPALTGIERGLLVRHLADRDHTGPDGERVVVSRSTIDRWIRMWRAGGFNALVPESRTAHTKIAPSFLELAVALKRERPARSAVQVCRIIQADRGWSPSRRTVQRLFTEHGLNGRRNGQPVQVFGRFEANVSNELWTGDAMHGPVIAGHKAYLLAFIDDHSRLLPGYRWCHSEDTVRLEAALRSGLTSRGIPGTIYLDNGSAMASKQFLRGVRVARDPPHALDTTPPRRKRQDRTVLPNCARPVRSRNRHQSASRSW